MLNEERVILMTHMASYEKGEGKKNVKIANYFRSDYVTIQVLKAIVCATIVYAFGFALYVFYDFEGFMQNLYKIDLFAFAKNVLRYYIIAVVLYAVLTYVVSTYHYIKAKKSLKVYYQNLKKLNALYGEDKKESASAGGRK
ncbi:MAG: hypothetical protein ACI4HQ_08675 [Acetatifactor sp.]